MPRRDASTDNSLAPTPKHRNNQETHESGNQNLFIWGGLKAQQLRALAAAAEDFGSIPEPMLGSTQPPVTPAPGNLIPSSGLLGQIHT